MAAEPTRRIKAGIRLCVNPCFPSWGSGWKRGFSWPSRRRTGTRTRCASHTAAERNENPRAAVGCECEIAGNGFARPSVSDSGEVVPKAVGRERYGATTRRQLRGAVTCCKKQVEISLGANWRSHVRQPEPPTGLGSHSRWGVLLVRTGNAASLRKKSGATTDKAWGRDLFTGADRSPSLERSQENRNDSAFCSICIRKAGPIAGEPVTGSANARGDRIRKFPRQSSPCAGRTGGASAKTAARKCALFPPCFLAGGPAGARARGMPGWSGRHLRGR